MTNGVFSGWCNYRSPKMITAKALKTWRATKMKIIWTNPPTFDWDPLNGWFLWCKLTPLQPWSLRAGTWPRGTWRGRWSILEVPALKQGSLYDQPKQCLFFFGGNSWNPLPFFWSGHLSRGFCKTPSLITIGSGWPTLHFFLPKSPRLPWALHPQDPFHLDSIGQELWQLWCTTVRFASAYVLPC